MHSVTVAAIVFDPEGRVLLVQRHGTQNWEPPGGVLKARESIEDGALREVQEETGLLISVKRLTGVYKNPRHGVLSLVFRCDPVAGQMRPSEETPRVEWVEITVAQQWLSSDYEQWLTDCVSEDNVAVRLQEDTIMGASSSPISPLADGTP